MTRLPLIALAMALCPASAWAQGATAPNPSDSAAPATTAPGDAAPQGDAARRPASSGPADPASKTSPTPTPVPADTAAAGGAPTALPPAHYGSFGLDLAARDLSVKPGDDFDRYTSGKWKDAHPIPADRASVDAFRDVFDRNEANVRTLITQAPAGSAYGTLYRTFVDEPAVEAVGDAPLRADIAKIAALPDKTAFARAMGRTLGGFGLSIVDVGVDPDTRDPATNVLYLDQSGLGLPERDYYLKPEFQPQRDAYVAFMARSFQMLGHADPAGDAAKVMAFETAIAQKSWAIADRRDIIKTNNPMSSAELASYAPGLDWAAFGEGAGIGPQQRIIVQTNTAIRDIAALYGQTPLATLKLWQEFHVASSAAPYLNKAWVDSRFQYTSALSGVKQNEPRWKRGVRLVNGSLGELVGQDYVKAYFPADSKAKMDALVVNLKAAMADRIRANTWMAPPTKQAALDKLSRMTVMVGYPDKFRDYSALSTRPGDLYGDVQRAQAFNYAYAMEDLDKPVDRKKWAMSPQTVNAYNGGNEVKIVFPAGILNPPFFDPTADPAVNYGAIGVVIGHEISHSFDDQGRKIDASGAVRDWWTPADAARFDAKAQVYGAQFAQFEPVPGTHINPGLTMGENIADFAGLQVSLDAYHRSLAGKPAPVIDGLTGDQRFFLAFAQVWRANERPDSLRQQVTSDPHSPGRFRVLGPLPNIDAWYAAFGVKPGDSMYIPPEKRVRLW